MITPTSIITHLLVLLVTLLLLCVTHAAPEPVALVALPSHTPTTNRAGSGRRYTASAHGPQPPEIDHEVLPFVIISTLDGALHAVERDSGKLKWTLRDGVEPLVGGGIRGKGHEEEYIVEPLSGSLYAFDDEEETKEDETPRIRKLPLSVEQLIELSPFTFPHSPSRIFTGSKHTSLLTIDLRSGQQLDCFSATSANHSHYDEDDCVCESDQLLDDLEGKSRSNRDVLFVGRTDYGLTIHSPPPSSMNFSPSTATVVPGSGESRRGAGLQEITYSTYTPNSYDRPLADFWVKNGLEEQRWGEESGSKKMRVELRHDGVAVGVEPGGGVKWLSELGGVGIAVYDLLVPLDSASANPILVPQPPPHLPSLFPLPADHRRAYFDILSKPPTTYIGSVPLQLALPSAESTGNTSTLLAEANTPPRQSRTKSNKPLLYALSSNSYPLINFAPPPRPGSLANGSFLLSDDLPEKDTLLPYLIDPPAEDKTPATVGEKGLALSAAGIRERQHPRQNWPWWILSMLGAIVLCGLAIAGLNRSSRVKQTAFPANEKTPLIVAPEIGVSEAEKKVEEERSAAELGPAIPTIEIEDTATPKKKSTRRRVRGKKKGKTSSATILEDDGDEDDDDRGDGASTSATPSKAEKPLPDLPREMSSTDLLDADDKERLAISDTIIGFGSHGTVVLKGTWGGRPVAVKRLLSDFTRLASQEVKLLQASDDHPNVIRYYCQEKRDNFLYIALDLCQASLADLIETPDKHIELASALDRKKALSQVTAGLKHLHGMKIIHRDIKPQNVLVSRGKDGSLRLLVSDFGLARRLDQGQSSFAPTANNLAGSLGWRAPECIRGQVRLNEGVLFDPAFTSSSSSSSSSTTSSTDDATMSCNSNGRLTKAVDLFALGCLYFWVLLSGEHPYGETYNRESNIVKGEIVNIHLLDVLGEEGEEAKDLIGNLLSMDPAQRPDTAECLVHPFFWTPAKRLAFLCDASDRFEIMESDPPEATIQLLESDAADVVGKDWYSKLDKVFINNLGKYRKYKGNSVRDLLRAMRNKKHHYQDLEPSLKRHLGNLPNGFLYYFTSRFPKLFLHVYHTIQKSRLRHENKLLDSVVLYL